ncbi:MAG TPA: hypothetical protein VLA46_11980, partial [Saprospiraceae bacterium]|nr:hypothetical protein [Saprospiraceae bacterium]
MKRTFYISIITLLYSLGHSQGKGDYNWQLGVQSYPLSSPYPLSQEISFDKGYRIIDTLFRPMSMGYFNTSLSDFNGKLLLYSNGCKINDGNHELIANSVDLSPGSVNDEWCGTTSGEYPISDGGLFLSFNDDNLVLLLHQRLKILGSPLRVFVDALFYTSLLRTESSYIIIEKSIPIILDTLSSGRLEAIEGMRPGYWWIIQGVRNSNDYYTIGIDH